MKTSVKLIKALAKKCQRVRHCSMFGAVNYRVAGEAGMSLCSAALKPENAFTAGHGGQLWKETEKEKQIA